MQVPGRWVWVTYRGFVLGGKALAKRTLTNNIKMANLSLRIKVGTFWASRFGCLQLIQFALNKEENTHRTEPDSG